MLAEGSMFSNINSWPDLLFKVKVPAVVAECQFRPTILNAEVNRVRGQLWSGSEEGDEAVVTCRKGYLTADNRVSYRIICNKYGMWTTLSGSPFQHCESEQNMLVHHRVLFLLFLFYILFCLNLFFSVYSCTIMYTVKILRISCYWSHLKL